MKKLEKYIAILCCFTMLTLCSCSTANTSNYASNNAVSNSNVVSTEKVSNQKKVEILKHWIGGTDSAKEKIYAFVKDITNKNGSHFIPVEDRIATFDMDGTILCEEPDSYNYYIAVDYIQTQRSDDKEMIALLNKFLKMKEDLPELLKKAKTPEEKLKIQNEYWALFDMVISHAFDGAEEEEVEKYAKTYMQNNTSMKSKKLKCCETFYRPMIELIQYLQENDFQVYVISGSLTSIVRGCVESYSGTPSFALEPCQMIGSLASIDASGNKNFDSSYMFQPDDKVVHNGTLNSVSNVKMQKVRNIYWQIGKVPVFACGNTDGDFSMLNYAASGDYEHISVLIWHDDGEREYEYDMSDDWLKACKDYNWLRVSMKNEWSKVF